jgi:PKD repeat protein
MIKMERKTASGIMLTLLIGSMLFSAISLVKGQTDIHNLRVSLEAGPSSGGHHLTIGQSRVLNATVWNDGNVTEPTVTLQLLINGSEAVHSTVANLSSGAPFKISYTWVPSESNVYNITAYAPPITSPEPETNTTNNFDLWLVNVCNNTPPTVDFTYSPQLPLAGQNVTFDASNSSDPDWGNITYYIWNFNGTTVPKNEPSTNYPFPGYGNATVTLTLYDTEGENSSLPKPLRICAKPVASFNISGLCYKGYQLTFDATGSFDRDNDTGSTRGIANYAWDFGDNSSGPNQNITHHPYATNAAYTVNLTVTDYDGFNYSSAIGITIYSDIPTADFNITSPHALPGPYYVNENLTFDASSSVPDGAPISSYIWNWNDTTTNTTGAPVISHAFTQPATYNVTLTVKDANNKTSPPTVKGIVVIPRVLLEVTNSTGGTTLTANPGETFNINIIVINVEALYTFNFTLKYPGGYPSPLLKFNALIDVDFQLGPSTNDQLEGTITVNGTKPIGGTTGNFTLAIITFGVTNPGNCSLNLIGWTLLNSTGANISASAKAADFFSTKPVANFTCPQYAVANMTVVFDASASYDPDNMTAPNRGIATYTWNFDDGNVTSVTSPTITHRYESAGSYNVNLNVTDYASETWSMNYTVIVVTGRDVAVVKIELGTLHFNSTTGLYETAGKLPMNVTVTNEGNSVSETFNVTIYFGNTSIETELVTNLMPGKNTTVRFGCPIVGITKGIYNISAYAWPVPGETNTADNTATDGLVSVFIPGDVDRNGTVNVLDAIDLSNQFGKKFGEPGFLKEADFDDSGVVDILDAITLANNFGQDP